MFFMIEIINTDYPKIPVSTVLFDFDGTISTLRYGWEKIMEPMMIELLSECTADSTSIKNNIEETVRAYIDESTGIQTIQQMKWLAEQIKPEGNDPWKYKAEYNRRLMEVVSKRRNDLTSGTARREEFLIAGSEELLKALCEMGADLYVASGTDDHDVKAEVHALGLSKFFKKIAGAPQGAENCAKEDVIHELLQTGVSADRLAIVGDGKVEIMIGHEKKARTLGVASNEEAKQGINPVKKQKLIKAGADVITGDFLDLNVIMRFFKGER